jgi:hypothetical protein
MWTQQDRSRTPSTLIWSSRLYKFIQDVKSTLLVDPVGQKPNTLNPDLVNPQVASPSRLCRSKALNKKGVLVCWLDKSDPRCPKAPRPKVPLKLVT